MNEIFWQAMDGNPWQAEYRDTLVSHGISEEEVVSEISKRKIAESMRVAKLPPRIEDSPKAGTVYFLAMEALDGVDWRKIYADKIKEEEISAEDVVSLKTKLLAQNVEAWTGVKEFTLDAFDDLDLDQDGFITKEELQSTLSRGGLGLRETSFVSFLLNNIDDIQTNASKDGDEPGISRKEVDAYFLKLVEAASSRLTRLAPNFRYTL